MCHLVHQPPVQAAAGADATNTSPPHYARPRWVAAAGCALLGTFALAAYVVASSARPVSDTSSGARMMPTATQAAPQPPLARNASLPADDDVPSAPAASRAGVRDCHHAL